MQYLARLLSFYHIAHSLANVACQAFIFLLVFILQRTLDNSLYSCWISDKFKSCTIALRCRLDMYRSIAEESSNDSLLILDMINLIEWIGNIINLLC